MCVFGGGGRFDCAFGWWGFEYCRGKCHMQTEKRWIEDWWDWCKLGIWNCDASRYYWRASWEGD